MERNHAEAIAKAIMEPGLKAQEELRRKREAERRSLAVRRSAAGFVLVGFAIGAGAAYLVGVRFTTGGLWGGMAGAVVGWAVGAWRTRGGAV